MRDLEREAGVSFLFEDALRNHKPYQPRRYHWKRTIIIWGLALAAVGVMWWG